MPLPAGSTYGKGVGDVTPRGQAITLVVHAVLVSLIVTAATVLAGLHDIDAQAYTAIIGTAVGLIGGSAGSLAIVGFNGNGKNGNGAPPPPVPPAPAPERSV